MANLTANQIAGYAQQAGFRGADITKAVAIAFAESGGNPRSINRANRNGSTDYGLMQINSVHKSLLAAGNWSDPLSNMQMARRIFLDAGGKWTPWATYNSGSYRLYMGKAAGATYTTSAAATSAPASGGAPDAGTVPADPGAPATDTAAPVGDVGIGSLPRLAYGLVGGLALVWALYQISGAEIPAGLKAAAVLAA